MEGTTEDFTYYLQDILQLIESYHIQEDTEYKMDLKADIVNNLESLAEFIDREGIVPEIPAKYANKNKRS